MAIFDKIRNEIKLNIYSIKEGIVDIAESISNKTRILHHLYNKAQYDKELSRMFIDIGKYYYKKQPNDITSDIIDNEINTILSKVKIIKDNIYLININIEETSSEINDSDFNTFITGLKKSGMLMKKVQLIGNNEVISMILPLKQELLVFSIMRNNLLYLPSDDFILKKGDYLFLLGSSDILKSFLSEHAEIFKSEIN